MVEVAEKLEAIPLAPFGLPLGFDDSLVFDVVLCENGSNEITDFVNFGCRRRSVGIGRQVRGSIARGARIQPLLLPSLFSLRREQIIGPNVLLVSVSEETKPLNFLVFGTKTLLILTRRTEQEQTFFSPNPRRWP